MVLWWQGKHVIIYTTDVWIYMYFKTGKKNNLPELGNIMYIHIYIYCDAMVQLYKKAADSLYPAISCLIVVISVELSWFLDEFFFKLKSVGPKNRLNLRNITVIFILSPLCHLIFLYIGFPLNRRFDNTHTMSEYLERTTDNG
jgi:hypothetical protein